MIRHPALDPAKALARAAIMLGGPDRPENRLPRLFLFIDPERTPDPVGAVESLPAGAGVIYRTFGRSDAIFIGECLAAICRKRGIVLLVGQDERLATRLSADGLHLPERDLGRLVRLRSRRPKWILTAAAHSVRAARLAASSGAQIVFVSAVFPSRSPSAGPALGPARLAALVSRVKAPVYALGGLDRNTVHRLEGTGAQGAGAVEALC